MRQTSISDEQPVLPVRQAGNPAAPAAAGVDTGRRGNHGRLPPVRERDADRGGDHTAAWHRANLRLRDGRPSQQSLGCHPPGVALAAGFKPGRRNGYRACRAPARLLVILEPATAAQWELVRAGYDANWLCYIASHATEHAAELERQAMQRVLALPGDIWL